MYFKGYEYILLVAIILFPAGFLITLVNIWIYLKYYEEEIKILIKSYLIAVLNNHVGAGFPYISDTGALPPESCVFGQFLTINAFLSMYMYIFLVFKKKDLNNFNF